MDCIDVNIVSFYIFIKANSISNLFNPLHIIRTFLVLQPSMETFIIAWVPFDDHGHNLVIPPTCNQIKRVFFSQGVKYKVHRNNIIHKIYSVENGRDFI